MTAADVGMTVRRMDVVAEECRWTTGRSPSGVSEIPESSPRWGSCEGWKRAQPPCSARTTWPDALGVVGAGKVGGRLIAHLSHLGARVVAVDPSPSASADVLHAAPGTQFVASVDDLLARELDVLAQRPRRPADRRARRPPVGADRVRCGANNQLADDAVADLPAAREIGNVFHKN